MKKRIPNTPVPIHTPITMYSMKSGIIVKSSLALKRKKTLMF
jgi:hypothetical protein